MWSGTNITVLTYCIKDAGCGLCTMFAVGRGNRRKYYIHVMSDRTSEITPLLPPEGSILSSVPRRVNMGVDAERYAVDAKRVLGTLGTYSVLSSRDATFFAELCLQLQFLAVHISSLSTEQIQGDNLLNRHESDSSALRPRA